MIAAIGAGLVAAVAAARVHVEPVPSPVPDATASSPTAVEAYARLASGFVEDARRCATDLRTLAAGRPLPTARALELAPSAATGGGQGLAAVALRAIAEREEVAVHAVQPRAGARDEGIAPAAARAARAHAAAERLCAARDAAMAATLSDPRAVRPGSR